METLGWNRFRCFIAPGNSLTDPGRLIAISQYDDTRVFPEITADFDLIEISIKDAIKHLSFHGVIDVIVDPCDQPSYNSSTNCCWVSKPWAVRVIAAAPGWLTLSTILFSHEELHQITESGGFEFRYLHTL